MFFDSSKNSLNGDKSVNELEIESVSCISKGNTFTISCIKFLILFSKVVFSLFFIISNEEIDSTALTNWLTASSTILLPSTEILYLLKSLLMFLENLFKASEYLFDDSITF